MYFRLRLRRRAGFLLLSAAFGLLAQARAASGQEAAWTTNGPVGGSVYCLVPDPSRASTLYAGTAEGVFKSDDGGASWRAASAGMPSARVQTIAIDPSSTSTLYAGTLTPDGTDSVGIFKSTDGAASWTAINEGLSPGSRRWTSGAWRSIRRIPGRSSRARGFPRYSRASTAD